MVNPAILKFICELETEITPLIKEAKLAGCHNFRSFGFLIRETRNYIADIVWCCLCREPASQNHLNVIAYACKSVNVTSISTLCHDTHVETYLKEKGISLSDGFSEPEADVKYWNGDFCLSGTTPFLKLHGSVDWFRFDTLNGDSHNRRIGIPINRDCYHTHAADGERQWPFPGRPLLLIGTFNKISAYSSGIFGELHNRFRVTIREAEQIVICGYGFGDKGINTGILEWYEPGRRLVIIHPCPKRLAADARPAIQRILEGSNSISFIKKRFQDVDIHDFLAAIGSKP